MKKFKLYTVESDKGPVSVLLRKQGAKDLGAFALGVAALTAAGALTAGVAAYLREARRQNADKKHA